MNKPHYTVILKAFIDGSSGGIGRVKLRDLGLIEVVGPGPKGPRYRLTARGEERARRLGYLKSEWMPIAEALAEAREAALDDALEAIRATDSESWCAWLLRNRSGSQCGRDPDGEEHMSGGSYDCFYSRLEEVALRINGKSSCQSHVRPPLRHAFKTHLLKVAAALKAIEWNDSGDGDSGECAKIEACLGPGG